MTTPFGIVVMSSQVLYQAAQNAPHNTGDMICQIVMRVQSTVPIGKAMVGFAVLVFRVGGVRLAQQLWSKG